MPHNVREHTRRTASGKTTKVRNHDRKGGSGAKPKRKYGPTPGHAWKLTKRARAHHRRGRKGKAFLVAGIALLEVVAWLTLNGTAFLCTLIAGLLVGLSILLTK